jgi:hypothetical protein
MSTTPNIDLSPLANVLPNAHNVVCFLHPQTTYDAVAAALALRLALIEAGKSCQVVCEEPMRVEYNALVDIDQVTAVIGNRDLVLSFAYSEEQVDKVSYNVDEAQQRFELVVSPKNGYSALDPSTIQFRHAGLSADVIVLFGYHSLDELGNYYQQEKSVIDSAYTMAITQAKVPTFAKLHVQLQADQLSYSELMYFLIRQFHLGEAKDDVASNLLSGIEYATDRFQQTNINPRSFESIAFLMRQGAHRVPNNPAFAHLATPIRGVASANEASNNSTTILNGSPMNGMPMSGMPMNGMPMGNMPMNGSFRPGVTPMPMAPAMAAPISEAVNAAPNPVHNVSPSEFAQAMAGGRS